MTFKPRKTVHVLKRPLMYAVVLFAVFYGIVAAWMALGVYKSRLPVDEYKHAVPFILEKRAGAEGPVVPNSEESKPTMKNR